MFNSSVLDVAIGLIFVYLILGLMCTTVHEWIAQFFKMRSQMLKTGIQALLNTTPANTPAPLKDLAADFYNHSLIKSLTGQGGDPSYIPAHTFSTALIDILGGQAGLSAEIEKLPDSNVKKSLLLFLHQADGQLAAFQQKLETWFNDAMDRVSGWYKRWSQIITVVVAVLITIFSNADSVGIARKLFVNPTLRAIITQEAKTQTGQASQGLTTQERADLSELTGWSEEFRTFHAMLAKSQGQGIAEIDAAGKNDSFPGMTLFSGVFFPWLWAIAPAHLFGWLLTAIAASLGAPFWFDTLNRFMNIRAAGTSPNEKGQDRSKV